MKINVKEFSPVLYLFLLPSVFGGLWLGPSFVLLGLIYWFIGDQFARRGAVLFAVLFILTDIPLYFGAGMATPIVIMIQLALIAIFAIAALILKKVHWHKTKLNSEIQT